MKIKARCPHCEMTQLFKTNPNETVTEVTCHMDWCRKPFVPTKSNQGSNFTIKEDDLEDLKNASAREPSTQPLQ